MNKSLTLYASILLLSPLSFAMDYSFFGAIGDAGHTFGDCEEKTGHIGGTGGYGGKIKCMSYHTYTYTLGLQSTFNDTFVFE